MTGRKCCATVGGEPHTSECEAVWRATRDFPTAAALSTHGTSDPRTQPTAVVQASDDCPICGHCVMDCCVDVAGVCDRNDLHPEAVDGT